MNPADPLPPLPPLPPDPLAVREHPIDRALAALSEATVLALASSKPSRFVEAGTLTTLAHQLQQLRPANGIADLGMDDDEDGDIGMGPPIMMPNRIGRMRRGRFNDGADLNREMIMMAQGFLKTYQEIEKTKASRPAPDVRLNEVTELAELMQLRMQLMREGADLPAEINTRIDHLLQRIGEPPPTTGESPHEHHQQTEPRPDPVVSAEPLRGHPPDGAGEQD